MITTTRFYESKMAMQADIAAGEKDGWFVRQIIVNDPDRNSFDAIVVYEKTIMALCDTILN